MVRALTTHKKNSLISPGIVLVQETGHYQAPFQIVAVKTPEVVEHRARGSALIPFPSTLSGLVSFLGALCGCEDHSALFIVLSYLGLDLIQSHNMSRPTACSAPVQVPSPMCSTFSMHTCMHVVFTSDFQEYVGCTDRTYFRTRDHFSDYAEAKARDPSRAKK